MLSLIFSDIRELLGEVQVERGKLLRLTLTAQGEALIGPEVRLWQTRGVPARKDMERSNEDGSSERISFTDYVHTDDGQFSVALEDWCHQRKMALLSLSHEMVPCWEILVHLPFEPEERFAFLIAIQHTPQNHLDDWKRHLEEAHVLILHHRAETRKAIHHLKEQVSQLLLHPFTKTCDVLPTSVAAF